MSFIFVCFPLKQQNKHGITHLDTSFRFSIYPYVAVRSCLGLQQTQHAITDSRKLRGSPSGQLTPLFRLSLPKRLGACCNQPYLRVCVCFLVCEAHLTSDERKRVSSKTPNVCAEYHRISH